MGHTVFGIGGRAAGRSGYLARLVCLISALVLVAGCQDGRQNYLTTGIGSDLSAPDLARTETLQNRYFDYLCEQATYGSPKAGSTCTGADWNLITYQGMNDIDRRCDSYLQWLDNRRKSEKPWLSQIGDTASATAVILPVVGAGTKAITIVGQAFQLLTKSVENYHSRLLLEIESSTIHSIVLQSRYDFRKHLQDKKVNFSNKPQAEHALRSYLRLCLPFAIEARINNYSTLGASGERPDAGNTLGDLPVVGAFKPIDPITDGQGNGGIPPTPDDLQKYFGVPNFTVARLNTFQRATCTPVAGVVGPRTKAAIAIVEQTLDANKHAVTIDGFLSDTEYKNVIESPCSQNFTNYFEKITLAGGAPEEIKHFNNFVAPAYRKVFNTDPLVDGEPVLSKFRGAVAELRRELSSSETFPSDFKVDFSTWITPQLHAAMEAKVLE